VSDVDKAVQDLMKSIHDATGHFTGVEINRFIGEINHLVAVATLEGRQSMKGNLDQIVTREREGAVAKDRDRIRAACREFNPGDTLIVNVPTLLLESSVLHPRKC